MTKSKPVVFFGSGPVAAASLEFLAKDFELEAVITKPKPSHHRGSAPVIEAATRLNLPIYTVANKSELDKLFSAANFNSSLGVLVDFGILVSRKTIDYFPLGIVNSHFSLLPQWRGADPITFAILSGQKTTGISLMLLAEAMDEGPLLAQAPLHIDDGMDTPALTTALIELSAHSLKEVLPLYLDGGIQPAPQEDVTIAESKIPSYSRKLTKEDGIMDWHKPAEVLEREVRAFMGWPKSHAKIHGQDIVVLRSRVVKSATDGDLVAECSPGWLEITRLRAPSGRIMSGAEFLRGYKH